MGNQDEHRWLVGAQHRVQLRQGTAVFIPPMLATLNSGRVPSGEEWLSERKLDGVRALVVCDGSGDHAARLYSRNRKPMTGT